MHGGDLAPAVAPRVLEGEFDDAPAAADRLESAIAAVIAEGRSVTYDMKPTRDDPTAVGTSQVADAIIDRMGVRV